jgi:hypothetical protein
VAQPLPRLAIITADGTEYLPDGNLASAIELLLQEGAIIEACGEKVHIELDCAGGYSTATISKRGIRLKKSA